MSTLDKNLLLEMFRKMEKIRRMDLKIAQLVKKGKVPGMEQSSIFLELFGFLPKLLSYYRF